MMKSPFTAAHRPLRRVHDDRRTHRLPDLRQMGQPRLSGAQLGSEVDHDELIVHRSYRVYTDPTVDKFTHAKLDEPHVKYFVFEFSQKNPGDERWYSGVKVVRLLRLTRVPRYLRQGGSGGMNLVFEQQRDVLMALRQEQVLFLNLVARSPHLPLVFAYGVQAVGETFEEAAEKADESYAVLHHQLHGTYQQLMTKPLSVDEGEYLARYQTEWSNVAMARGRPMPVGGTLGAASALDGNRTDIESANNQLEAFIRGMANSSFMLSLVTVPLSPAEMAGAWRNISHKLSEIRSDQQGARGVNAGVAMPLTMGSAFGGTQGDTHSTGASEGVGDNYGISRSVGDSYSYGESVGVSQSHSAAESHSATAGESQSVTLGESQSVTQGESASVSVGESVSQTVGESASISAGENATVSAGENASVSAGENASVSAGENASVSAGENLALTDSLSQGESRSVSVGESISQTDSVGQSLSHGQSHSVSETASESVSASQSVGESVSVSQGLSQSVSQGQSLGLSQGAGFTQGVSISEGQSLGVSQSAGQNWSSSISDAFGATTSRADGISQSFTESIQQAFQLSNQSGDSITGGSGSSDTRNFSGGLLGFSGGGAEQFSQQFGTALSNTDGLSLGLTGGGSLAEGLTSTLTNGLSQTITAGETLGGSLTEGVNATNSVGRSESVSASQSVGSSQTSSISETIAASQGISHGMSSTQSLGQTIGQSVGVTQGQSLSETASVGRSVGQGVSASQAAGQTFGVGQSLAQGQSAGIAAGQSAGVAAGQSAGVAAGQSAGISTGQTMGVSQGVSSAATQGASASATQGVSASATQGISAAATQGVSSAETRGVSASQTAGASQSASETLGRSVTDGQSSGVSSNQQLSDGYMVAMSRSAQQTGSLGVVPTFGVNITKQTFDEAKRMLGDILEAQMKRYIEGLETAGFLYQMFLITPDRETLAGGAGLLVSAFAGSGSDSGRVAQRFHTVTEFEDDERTRLLDHFRMFTSYRRREPVVEELSPFMYSSYVTASEMAAFCHPPTSEAAGLLAVHDSAPVLALPADRQNRELFLGYLFNGERAEVTPMKFGIDVAEQTHTLITGVTGSGKTTTLMRLLYELAQVEQQVVMPAAPGQLPEQRTARASVLALDWMRNMRNIASVVDPDRLRFYSIAKPEMGEFRWNLLAIPTAGMAPNEWLNQQADNMVASWNLGEFGRSLIAEFLGELYHINRLKDHDLLEQKSDDAGVILRPAIVLPAIDPATLPDGAVQYDDKGQPFANVYTCPELSRLVSIEHLAVLVMAKVEEMASQDGARMSGTAMRDRLQSLWRRISYFAPNGQLSDLLGCDTSLDERQTLTVDDLVAPDQGLVTVIETDGLDLANRRLILGSVLLAVYRHGLAHGEGTFDHGGRGPGTHIVLEEAHELFGEGGEDDDSFSVATRNALYESMFRRSRALGIRLTVVVQNPGALPVAVTSNTSTVFVHKTYDKADRQRVFDLLNWNNQVGQQQREWRWLGEMPLGYCIARLNARESFLESAPMQFKAEPAPLDQLSDADMIARAAAARQLATA